MDDDYINGECVGDCELCSAKNCAGREKPELDWEEERRKQAREDDRAFRKHSVKLIETLHADAFDKDTAHTELMECEVALYFNREICDLFMNYYTSMMRVFDYYEYFGADETFKRYKSLGWALAVDFRSVYLGEKEIDAAFERKLHDFHDGAVEDMLRKFPEEHFVISEESKKLLSCLLEGYLSGDE